jgi:hypothetical protein
MAATPYSTVGTLSSGTFSGNLGSLLTEAFKGEFESLRDEEKTFIARLAKEDNDSPEYRFIVEDATYSPVWSATEAMQMNPISATVLATDGLGTSTAILAPASHPVLRANVTMRYNYVTTQFSGAAVQTAKSAAALVDLVKYETKKAIADFWRALNIRALSTSTSAGNSGRDIDTLGIIFRNGAVTYAGINASTYPAWAIAADTATTTLAVGPMQTLINKVEGGTEVLNDELNGTSHAEANLTIRDGDVKELWCSPTRADDYFNLMSGYRRFGPDDTLDAGGADAAIDTGLRFKTRPIYAFKRFPTTDLIMYGGGLKLVTFKSLTWADKSATTVDSKLMVGSAYLNLVARHRRHGRFTALT